VSDRPKRPEWVKNASLRWQEDECLRHDPNAERLSGAWRRLFGVVFEDDAKIVEQWDGGDQYWYLHDGGRVHVHAYDGYSIWKVWAPNPLCRTPCGGLGCGDEACRGGEDLICSRCGKKQEDCGRQEDCIEGAEVPGAGLEPHDWVNSSLKRLIDVREVDFFKAEGPTYEDGKYQKTVRDLRISFVKTLPKSEPKQDHRQRLRLFRDQARTLHEALRSTLPGGTYDALLTEMLEARLSELRVPHAYLDHREEEEAP
jgi:hypothetical protein